MKMDYISEPGVFYACPPSRSAVPRFPFVRVSSRPCPLPAPRGTLCRHASRPSPSPPAWPWKQGQGQECGSWYQTPQQLVKPAKGLRGAQAEESTDCRSRVTAAHHPAAEAPDENGALLGSRWARAAAPLPEGKGTGQLLRWSISGPLSPVSFKRNGSTWNCKGYYFHYFPLSQYSRCLNVSRK